MVWNWSGVKHNMCANDCVIECLFSVTVNDICNNNVLMLNLVLIYKFVWWLFSFSQ